MSPSDPTAPPPAEPLGIMALISKVFAIFTGHFQVIFLVALLYSVASIGVSLVLVGPEQTFGLSSSAGPAVDTQGLSGSDPSAPDGEAFDPGAFGEMAFEAPGPGDFVNGLVQILLSALFVAAMARLVVDLDAGRRGTAGDYLRAALGVAVPVAAITIVVAIAAGIGAIFLILPGLWVLAVFSVAVPSAAVEESGFGALGRSAALTKGYRWPIVGLGIVFALIVLGIGVLVGLLVISPLSLLFAGGGGPGLVGGTVLAVVTAVVGAAYAGLGAIPAPVLYMRLLELKERR
jgi:hypothetical protein